MMGSFVLLGIQFCIFNYELDDIVVKFPGAPSESAQVENWLILLQNKATFKRFKADIRSIDIASGFKIDRSELLFRNTVS